MRFKARLTATRSARQAEQEAYMKSTSNADVLLATIVREGTAVHYHKGQVLFSQGDPADAVFSIQDGKVKLTVISKQNKEAVIAILTVGAFSGEACLVGHLPGRLATASAVTDGSIVRLAKPAMIRLLRDDHTFSGLVLS